ncbi:beta-glycosyl hydrolase [Bacteroides ovatus]|uniref:glycoside hydrolase family 20 protein n=1 Tax=Bacteroides TaxID=816 RepID=UPI000E943B03|nr:MULTISPECIES: family 20 glycosylhydrolase [Bacteroides]MCS3177833.1 family 20 glycosylhydrolase [Candidatus Bacteroides intestinigallinarum]RGN55427.1 beta-N-acetylhexosaminidase [Bacteroides sp. OM05-10AA]RGQ60088.1 beta-N-acetylhexosaminidase [Bacteroides sp. AF27-33]CAG9890417.1 beta-glycosyl hydrolase [Bacteroides ovatus]
MNIRKEHPKVCLFLWILGMCFHAHPILAQSVIPVPLKMEQGTGSFLLSEKTKLYTNLQGGEAELWENYLKALPVQLKEARMKDRKQMLFLLITPKTPQLPSPESYTLSVTPQRIEIRATSGAGLFYGMQTLLQLMQPAGTGSYSVASVEIEDTPRFAYRGLMLDVSRHFSTKEFIKKQIDALAYYKINRLHLHLTDAAGWRLEIKKYPLLTDFAAWRTDPTWKKWWNGGRKYLRYDEPGASGGYYTQNDIREILEYARQHYITVIPEIEMPSHSEEVLAAYPQLSCSGEPYKNSDFCIGNEETFTFLENVLTEVMELFPSEYIHVGGDEAGKSAWKTCPKCQKRMKDEHLANVDELQSYLIHRIEKFLNNHGRRLLGWDEILQGGIAPNATVMSWRGEEGGIAAVTSGHHAIMTPGAYCYMDSYQDAPYSQPEAIGGYLPLKKVYAYDPVPASLTAEQAKLVYGVQGNLWVEYIPTPEHVEYMIYPRMLALAEVAWSAPERKSWPDFHTRALSAVADLQKKGYHPFDLSKEIGSRPESLQPVSHLALGKKVIYNSPYSPHYPAQGNTALTDGIRGDWTYGDGSWQGFISDNRLDVTIDMEKETPIHSVTAAFMQVVGAEVFLPETVIISISDDGINFTELQKQHFEVSKETPIRFTDISWQGEAKGRYVRYQAQAGSEFGGWIFTDEIIVK